MSAEDYEDQVVELPFGYIMEHVDSWDAFCDESGLDPYVLREGKALRSDLYPVSIGTLRKHGVIP